MKTKLVVVLLFSSWLCALDNNKGRPLEGAWLQDGVQWVSAPPDINPRLQSGQAAVLYFGEDHTFAVIYCIVGRELKRYMTISNGDPRAVYRGQWQVNGDVVTVTYRLVEATIPPPGQQIPGPLQRSKIEISGKSGVAFEGRTFHREVGLDHSAHQAVPLS